MKKEVSTQTCLCKALSMNYTCLRIAGQDQKENDSLIYTRQDIFGKKTLKDVWLSKKLKDVADERNGFLSLTHQSIKETESTESCMNGLNLSKEQLMKAFNKTFKTSKTFDECFDDFEILDEDFKQSYNLYDNHAIIQSPNLGHVLGLANLFNEYQNYLLFLIDSIQFNAFKDIINTIDEDLNSGGYKTFYFRKPTNPNVEFVTNDKIQELDESLLKEYSLVQIKIAETEKQILKVQKQLKKNYSDETLSQLGELNFQLNTHRIKKQKIVAISAKLTDFKDRMESTNIDYFSDTFTHIVEGVLDISSGVNPFDKSGNPVFNSTYMHRNEKDFFNYLFNAAGLEMPFATNKHKKANKDTQMQ